MGDSSHFLVTGGAGFIGSHIVDRLMQMARSVRVLDNLSSGNMNNVKQWLNDSRFEFVHGDLKEMVVAEKAVDSVDVVFHLAANPEVRVAEIDPSVHFRENLLTTFNLLEAMRKSESAKLIVFFSSSTVYGEPDEIPTPEDYGPLKPISLYGASKLGCEAFISAYCHTFGIRGLVFRLANIVGSRSTHGVIVDFINRLQKNPRELVILGDGTQNKSYLHIKDLVDATFVAFRSFLGNETPVEVYNVGSLDQVDVRRIAEAVTDEMSLKGVRFRFTGGVEGGRGWRGDVKAMLLSTNRLLGLGWRPRFSSQEAVHISCHKLLNSEGECAGGK